MSYKKRKKRLGEVVANMSSEDYVQIKRDAIEKVASRLQLADETEGEIERVARAYVDDLGMDELLDITNPDWLQ